MELSYYREQAAFLSELTRLSHQHRMTFFQHILLVTSSVFGILVALHDKNLTDKYIRWVFVASVLLVVLCILLATIILRIYSHQTERICQDFCQESLQALRKGRALKIVVTPMPKYTTLLETTLYILLCIALIALAGYAILVALHH
ncbi:hypothetical protein ACILD6_00205 [Capnocytophaga canimorsus]|uniref:hypothetical protein n=1 Tax=Capnocytophaga canimorsus TaxID=28188 RepID=UPI0037D7C520